MLQWLQRPLPPSSPYRGCRVPVVALRPHITACIAYLRISGPILGAILVKVLFFGMVSARAAELGSASAAAHQILFSLALFFAVFGDTVCQAAQAFLPSLVGVPDCAWRLAQALMLCGVLIATFNGVAAAAAATIGLPLFTGSAAVATAVWAVLPLFVAQLMLHCCSMCTEGILLAARDSSFLFWAYVVVFGLLKVRICRISLCGCLLCKIELSRAW
jgi:Na+-driven multidrug efflux pump